MRRPAVYPVRRIVCIAQYQDKSPVGRTAWEDTAGTTGLIQLFYYYYLSSVAVAVVCGDGVEKVIRPYLRIMDSVARRLSDTFFAPAKNL